MTREREPVRTRIANALFQPVSDKEGRVVSLEIWKQCRVLHEDIANILSEINAELPIALGMETVKDDFR